jgi:hypothetical protein
MPMYPPSGEPDDARIARNKAQGPYAICAIQILTGVFAGILRRFDVLSIIWVGSGLLGLLRLMLEGRGLSRTRQLCSLVAGVAILGVIAFLRN